MQILTQFLAFLLVTLLGVVNADSPVFTLQLNAEGTKLSGYNLYLSDDGRFYISQSSETITGYIRDDQKFVVEGNVAGDGRNFLSTKALSSAWKEAAPWTVVDGVLELYGLYNFHVFPEGSVDDLYVLGTGKAQGGGVDFRTLVTINPVLGDGSILQTWPPVVVSSSEEPSSSTEASAASSAVESSTDLLDTSSADSSTADESSSSTEEQSSSGSSVTAEESSSAESSSAESSSAESSSAESSSAESSSAESSSAESSSAFESSAAESSTAESSGAAESSVAESSASESSAAESSAAESSRAAESSVAESSAAVESSAAQSSAVAESSAAVSSAVVEPSTVENIASTTSATASQTSSPAEIVTSFTDFYTILKSIIMDQLLDPANSSALEALVDELIELFTSALGETAGPVFEFLFGTGTATFLQKRALDLESYLQVFGAFSEALDTWKATPEYEQFLTKVCELSNYVNMDSVHSSFLSTFGKTWEAAKAVIAEYAALDSRAATLSAKFFSLLEALSADIFTACQVSSDSDSITESSPASAEVSEPAVSESVKTPESHETASEVSKSSTATTGNYSITSTTGPSSDIHTKTITSTYLTTSTSTVGTATVVVTEPCETTYTVVESPVPSGGYTTTTVTEPCHVCETKTLTSVGVTTVTKISGAATVIVTEPCETTYTVVESPLSSGSYKTITVTEPCDECATKTVTSSGFTTITKTSGTTVVVVTELCETTHTVIESPLPSGGYATVTVTEPCYECKTQTLTSAVVATLTKTRSGTVVTVTTPTSSVYTTIVSPLPSSSTVTYTTVVSHPSSSGQAATTSRAPVIVPSASTSSPTHIEQVNSATLKSTSVFAVVLTSIMAAALFF